jgi:hypothetical protein
MPPCTALPFPHDGRDVGVVVTVKRTRFPVAFARAERMSPAWRFRFRERQTLPGAGAFAREILIAVAWVGVGRRA